MLEPETPPGQPQPSSILPELVGESVGITNLRAQVSHLLGRQGEGRRLPTFLLLGETGTGKGLLARAIHRASIRATRPLVDIDCAAIPETLLEAELFGVERGAFTDARQTKLGLFQTASGGTIFLDEVGLLPRSLQGKLLKVVEERGVRRLGSTHTEIVDLWVIAATNVDLSGAARDGSFREDLYHRLAAVTLILPPLRARGGDILLLANHFLSRACAEYRLPPKALAPEAQAAMLAYPWPGNVRELANMLERVVLMSGEDSVISAGLLGLPAAPVSAPVRAAAPKPPHFRSVIESFERERLLGAMRVARGNITAAAAHLGLPRNTLRYRLVKLGIGADGLREAPVRHHMPPAKISARTAAAQAPEVSAGSPVDQKETRTVTLLRAEVSETTEPSHQTDRMLDFIASKVQSFGGRVEATGGARVVATFGVFPCEDATRRAAYAAVTISKAAARSSLLNPGPATVRIAIHTCEASVRQSNGSFVMGGGDRRQAEGMLEAMAKSARPNAVVVSQTAEQVLGGRFELAPLAAGSGEAEPCFELVDHRGPGRRLGPPSVSPFVGRQHGLELLGRLFAQAEAGHGQVVGIVGEVGAGKSRLLHEFSQQLASRRPAYRWVRFVPYGRGLADLTVVEVLRQVWRIAHEDGRDVIVAKVRRGLAKLGMDPDRWAPCVLSLFGVALDGGRLARIERGELKTRVFDALRRIALATSERVPLIIEVEDLQEFGRTAGEFLSYLVENVPSARILLLTTYRPEYRPPWLAKSYVTQMTVPPLSRVESLAVLDGVMPSARSLEGLADAILDKAEGNPFFIENLARSAPAAGDFGAELPVPDSVRVILAARMDNLGIEARRLLQVASVFGRRVQARLLELACEEPEHLMERLAECKRLEFLHEEIIEGEPVYVFKHALVQQVAYQSLSPTDRQEIRRLAGLTD